MPPQTRSDLALSALVDEWEAARPAAFERLLHPAPIVRKNTIPTALVPFLPNYTPMDALFDDVAKQPVQSFHSSPSKGSVLLDVTDEEKKRQERDKKFAKAYQKHFYVVDDEGVSVIRNLFHIMGGDEMARRFDFFYDTAQNFSLDAQSIATGLANEQSKSPAENLWNGRYWLSELINQFPSPPSSTSFSSPLAWYNGNEKFMQKEEGAYMLDRRMDAFLAPRKGDVSTARPSWMNLLVNLEFGESELKSDLRAVQTSKEHSTFVKLLQSIVNGADRLHRFDTTRPFHLSLTTFGLPKSKEKARVVERKLVLALIDHELIRLFQVSDITGAGLPTFAAILATLAWSSIWELGMSPLFSYNIPPSTLDIVPSLFHLPSSSFTISPPVLLSPTPTTFKIDIADRRHSFFGYFDRGTSVVGIQPDDDSFDWNLRAYVDDPVEEEEGFIIKIQHVDSLRLYREAMILSSLNGSPLIPLSEGKKIAEYREIKGGLEKIDTMRMDVDAEDSDQLEGGSFNFQRHIPILAAAIAFDRMPFQSTPSMVPSPSRHLSLIVTRVRKSVVIGESDNPSLVLRAIISAAKTMKGFLRYEPSTLHRDPSTSNLLLSKTGIVTIVDFDCASNSVIPTSFGANARTGHLDTMAIALLRAADEGPVEHHFHFDIEGLLYCVWKMVVLRVPKEAIPPAHRRRWNNVVITHKFGPQSTIPTDEEMEAARQLCWNGSNRLVAELKQAGLHAYANLLRGLIALRGRGGLGCASCDDEGVEDGEVCGRNFRDQAFGWFNDFVAVLEESAKDVGGKWPDPLES